jgi:hypothetical protein
MWDLDHSRNLIDMQRKAALDYMGYQAKELLAEGYLVEADRVLDEMSARREGWRRERAIEDEREAA